MYHWHQALGINVDSLVDNKITEVSAGNQKICLLKQNGNIIAFTAKCPHAGAPLCEGWVTSKGQIACPSHKYLFDPKTGRNVSGEGYKLYRYPVEIREQEIFVGMLGASD